MGSYLHSFINFVELKAECVAKQLQTHHLTAPKYVKYMILSSNVSKYIDITNTFLEVQLLT